MRKWPLNSITLVAATHKRLEKAANGTSTQVATCMINKWRAKINGNEVYNVRNPSRMGDRKFDREKMVIVCITLESLCNQALKNLEEEPFLRRSPRIKFHTSPHAFVIQINLQSCPIVAILTKAQFLNPFSTNLLYWASWAWAYSRNSRSTQTQTLHISFKYMHAFAWDYKIVYINSQS